MNANAKAAKSYSRSTAKSHKDFSNLADDSTGAFQFATCRYIRAKNLRAHDSGVEIARTPTMSADLSSATCRMSLYPDFTLGGSFHGR
jgi:hypothetical protein